MPNATPAALAILSILFMRFLEGESLEWMRLRSTLSILFMRFYSIRSNEDCERTVAFNSLYEIPVCDVVVTKSV